MLTKKIQTALAFTASATLLSACITPYKLPQGAPTATITLIPSAQITFLQYNNADFTKTNTVGDSIFADGQYNVAEPIEANKKTYMTVMSSHNQVYSQWYCSNYFSFTPVAGRNYSVSARSVIGQGCSMSLIDNETQTPPPTFQIESGPEG
jgi:hypothetical protein